MRRSWYRSFVGLVLALGALTATGCGDVQKASDGSTIQFINTDFTKTILTGTCDPTFTTVTFTAIVRNPDGKPLNDLEVQFRVSLPTIFFVDASGIPIPYIDASGRSRVTRKTDDYGVVEVDVGVVDCPTGDDLQAISGTAFDQIRIEVEEEDASGGNVLPTAVADAASTTVTLGNPVLFDGNGSDDTDGSIVSYDWDFGDGIGTDTGATPSYTYGSTGTFTVTLTVTDDDGGTATDTIDITVNP